MPVSGVVVTCAEGLSQLVADRIGSFDGIEVHGLLPDGQIVAVVEADTVQAEVNLVSQLHEVEGVIAVRLAYHNFEDLEPEEPFVTNQHQL
jgi:periplasmic nitrate reductase NapD